MSIRLSGTGLVLTLLGIAGNADRAFAQVPKDIEAWAKEKGGYASYSNLPGGKVSVDLSFVADTDALTDADLKKIAAVKNLGSLQLNGARKVTDAGMKELAGVKLRTLFLPDQIGDAGLVTVGKIKSLEILGLPLEMTDAGLKSLAGLDRLRAITLRYKKQSDASWAELAKLPALEEVRAYGAVGTGVGMGALKAAPKLRYLELDGSKLTDAGLKEVAQLPRLQVLHASFTTVTDAGIEELIALKELKELWLSSTGLTDAGLVALGKLGNLTELQIARTAVTDAGAKTLATFKKLDKVVLDGTKVTPAGVDALQKARPKLDIRN